MNILITGIAGFLGSHIADELISSGHDVVGVDNLIGGNIKHVNNKCSFSVIDCQDYDKLASVMQGIDIVFHAACTAYDGFASCSPFLIASNTFNASASVFSLAMKYKVKKIVYCSSMARYGIQNTPLFTEDMVCHPNNPYAISKYASESLLINLCKTYDRDFVILIPHNIYGPRQKFNDPYRNVISIIINRLLLGQSPIIYGDGKQKRCFSYIFDIIPSIMKCITTDIADNEIINIGPDDNFISINELVDLISKQMNIFYSPTYYPDRPNEVKFAYCSSNKSRKLLNYKKQYSLEYGVAETIKYIKTQGPLKFDYNFNIEIIEDSLTPVTWRKNLI